MICLYNPSRTFIDLKLSACASPADYTMYRLSVVIQLDTKIAVYSVDKLACLASSVVGYEFDVDLLSQLKL